MHDRIQILLATYNRRQWLDAQMASYFEQTHQNWHLLVRDDGSTDATFDLLEQWRDKHPDRITILDPGGRNLGVVQNFARLMACAEGDYVMLSDCDDVWLPDKLEKSLAAMKKMEQQHGHQMPLLIHTNLTVVDQHLNTLDHSFWRYQHICPATSQSLRYELVCNAVTGCTLLMNRALVARSLPIAPEAIIHDWWIALVAASLGKVGFVTDPTVQYRQHEQNVLGSSRVTPLSVAGRAFSSKIKTLIQRSHQQARALETHLGPDLTDATRQLIHAWATMPSYGFLGKRWLLAKHRFGITGWFRQLGLYLMI